MSSATFLNVFAELVILGNFRRCCKSLLQKRSEVKEPEISAKLSSQLFLFAYFNF